MKTDNTVVFSPSKPESIQYITYTNYFNVAILQYMHILEHHAMHNILEEHMKETENKLKVSLLDKTGIN